ncbi:MarR family winged helix-turn-helix transcriptional regulator [Actinomadura oligospora]|uniref:MarR family winged helix-turn-helix transcriptional regulator n=1 Tax=Actinomadura oligospora TaxID=111804 RepID=UPI00047E5DDA|nr:MarR family transcriptional regulator [Actinomadura oligospora]
MAPHPGLVDQWRSLVTCYNTVACALDRALHDAHGLTMSEFETLERLVEAGCEQRRVQEIAAEMYLSQSALSRTIARLEKNGLVVRGMCESDRRGVFVTLTDEGRSRHAAASVTHRAILAEHLTPADEPSAALVT